MHLRQYALFLVVGGFVAVITIGVRELIAALFAVDTAISFSISVSLAYAVGIVLSYLLNHRFTFKAGTDLNDWRQLAAFIAIAGVGMVSTWLLSLAIRYTTPVGMIGRYSAAASFAVAAMLSSLLTYPLNSRWVFRPRPNRGSAIC